MNTTDTAEAIVAIRVPEEARLDVLPQHFERHLLTVEATIYRCMDRLAPDYDGGLWALHELSNGGFYMAPDTFRTFRLKVEGNGFAGTLSADAAGITACLFAFSLLSFRIPDPLIGQHFHWLRDFAAGHPEAVLIFAAID